MPKRAPSALSLAFRCYKLQATSCPPPACLPACPCYTTYMQFRVPQFIDTEDKVFGPLTLKQFGYVVGAGGLSFLIWTFIPIHFIAVLIIIPVAGLFLALAFARFNERSFGEILESMFTYYTGARIYTWKQPEEKLETSVDKIVAETQKEIIISKTNQDKIHDIALGLDVYESNIDKDDAL